ncbi:M20 family metallopeptidase [Polaromonas sp. P1(28)-8]|nr:M20 family metallopeptidase [Polaromonas sp. P1(28)-8]
MSPLLEELHAQADEFIGLRRDIHRHPELAFDEHRTSALVAEKLQGWGYAVERGLGGTGLVGRLVRGDGQRRLGLRADMDALPIHEATGLPHASCHAGVMHACGHDGHTAMLLAAARHLAEHGRFSGTLNLIFQPAEEGGGGAAHDGRWPVREVPLRCGLRHAQHARHTAGPAGAARRPGHGLVRLRHRHADRRGGHGAMPHRAADPVVAAASIVMALQTIVSRNIDPLQMAVVTVGALHAGKANNVIPQSATLELSVRALDREVRSKLEQRIRALIAAQAESFEVQAQIAWRPGYAVLVNTPGETAFAREVALELVGAERVTLQGPAVSGSEDFAFMLERVPGSYLFIGNGDGDSAGACMVHNPGYDFNDANLPEGAAYWVLLAQRFLV